MKQVGPITAFSNSLHQMKYCSPGEDFREAMNRVAFGLKDSDNHYHRLRHILLPQRWLPAGRVQAAVGSTKWVTLFNCFVSGTIADSYVDGPGSIMDRAKEAAATMRMGGGIGYDFTPLRPRGEMIAKLQSQASGPVSFMEIFDAVCRATCSSGHRRGAQMGILRCLDGESRVHTLNGIEKIKDLVGTRPYVYACDPKTRKVHVVQADKVFVSDTNRKLIRIVFDTKDSIDCTPDHLIMLSNGEYVQVGKLRRGDSIMAIKHGINQTGNTDHFSKTVGCTNGRAEYEHRVIARDILGEMVDANWHVHHRDEDSCNNDPSNLEMVNRSEHAKSHASNLNVHRLRIAAERKGKTRAELYGEEKAALWEARREESRKKTISNHRVVDIIQIGTAEEVFDISLPKLHNFAVSGVFVHNCDHPDIEEFINAKNNQDKLTGFNISIAVTDEFMECVLEEKEFPLKWGGRVYRYVDANTLWEKIMRSTFDWAEPGILFIDTINKMNNLYYAETIAATNPCCLTGDTLVAVAGRGPVPIRQLAEEASPVPVFAKNKMSGVTHVSWGRAPRWVRKANIVKITLDDGTTVRCSDDHHFPLRDGRRIKARDLNPGDSLFRFDAERHWKSKEMIVDGRTEHHLIAEAKFDREFEWGQHIDQFQVHHINHNHFDNDWDNIDVVTVKEHQLTHHRQAIAITAQNRYELPVNHKVVSVEPDGFEDVYNISVDKYHNYAIVTSDVKGKLSGVYTENSEQALPPFGACLLSSFNLVKYLTSQPVLAGSNPWSFDYDQLIEDIPIAVRALDNAIDKARYPLAEQKAEALTKRRMGIGITGLANTAEAMGFSYGSSDFLAFEDKVLSTINEHCYRASAELAAEKGAFPLYDEDRYLAGQFIKTLSDETQDMIRRNGIRNSHLTSIAPTGTISLAADNVSSALEPVFSYETTRSIHTPTGVTIEKLQDYGYAFLNIKGKLAKDVTADEHLSVLAVAQKNIDSAASKTINMDGRIMSWSEFKDIYRNAWERGCKGVATFNSSGKRMALLTGSEEPKKEEPEQIQFIEGASCDYDPMTGRAVCN
jgi:ribonucleotide reductase alpha subunit